MYAGTNALVNHYIPLPPACGKCYNKERQRVSKAALTALEKKDVLRIFPDSNGANKTILVLKKPKTAASI